MKIFRYLILVLLFCSLIGSNPAFAKSPISYEDIEWLMLNSEKKAFDKAKTEQEREKIIAQFYAARDPKTFTAKNEFELNYQQISKFADEKHYDANDARRYICLLFGEPNIIRLFHGQAVTIDRFGGGAIRIYVKSGEIWKYNFGQEVYRVIFAQLNPLRLQELKDRPQAGIAPHVISSSSQEILYIGTQFFTDIADFLENFFKGSLRLQATIDMIDALKKNILERAKNYYRQSQPKAKKKKYSHEWQKGLELSVSQFDIDSPKEVGINVWVMFNKDTLHTKKNKHVADLSLYCELRDINNKKVAYYQDDDIKYKLKKKEHYYYYFWGSVPVGEYKFFFEIGDNIGNRYKKVEIEINIEDFSQPGLKAKILVGREVRKERVQGEMGFFISKNNVFCLAVSGEMFMADDELLISVDISNFETNNYGFSCVDLQLSFARGNIEEVAKNGAKQRQFVPTGDIYKFGLSFLEEDAPRISKMLKINARDIIARFNLGPGVYLFKVVLLINDMVANNSYEVEYTRPIRFYITGLESIKK